MESGVGVFAADAIFPTGSGNMAAGMPTMMICLRSSLCDVKLSLLTVGRRSDSPPLCHVSAVIIVNIRDCVTVRATSYSTSSRVITEMGDRPFAFVLSVFKSRL